MLAGTPTVKISQYIEILCRYLLKSTLTNVSFLKKGALVNLTDITSPMVSYYNITKENTIVYEKEHYTVISNDKKINIDSFIGRINDNKYIVAWKNIELKIPTENNRIIGD